jgi:uncharacterized protein
MAASSRSPASRLAETLIIGAAGGGAMTLAGLPAGWLAGSILAVAAAALCRRPMHIHQRLGQVAFVVTGISLGGAVTPETVAGIAAWPMSLAALTLAMIVLTASVTLYLRYVHGWDFGSAFLGSCPGALSTVIAVAVDRNADVRSVAFVQTFRVVLLTAALPLVLAAAGITGEPPVPRAIVWSFRSMVELTVLLVVSTAAALGLLWLRFPGALLFGSMISSGLLHGTGIITASLPNWLAIAAFVTLGALTGARFAGMDMALFRRLSAAAIGSFLVGAVVAVLCALAAAQVLSLSVGDAVLAYAPGAIESMMILALALHFEPAFIAAHHLWRFLLVLIAVPLLSPHILPGPGAKPPD